MFGYNILTTQMMGYNHTILVQSQLCIIHNPRNNQYIYIYFFFGNASDHVRHITSHEGIDGEYRYISILSLTPALDRVGG